jgi:hypothetical protein
MGVDLPAAAQSARSALGGRCGVVRRKGLNSYAERLRRNPYGVIDPTLRRAVLSDSRVTECGQPGFLPPHCSSVLHEAQQGHAEAALGSFRPAIGCGLGPERSFEAPRVYVFCARPHNSAAPLRDEHLQ